MSLDLADQMLVVCARSFTRHMAGRFVVRLSGAILHRVSFPIVGLISSCSFACQQLSFSFLSCLAIPFGP